MPDRSPAVFGGDHNPTIEAADGSDVSEMSGRKSLPESSSLKSERL